MHIQVRYGFSHIDAMALTYDEAELLAAKCGLQLHNIAYDPLEGSDLLLESGESAMEARIPVKPRVIIRMNEYHVMITRVSRAIIWMRDRRVSSCCWYMYIYIYVYI